MPSCYEVCIAGPRHETGWMSSLRIGKLHKELRVVFGTVYFRLVLGAVSSLARLRDVTLRGVSEWACGASGSTGSARRAT